MSIGDGAGVGYRLYETSTEGKGPLIAEVQVPDPSDSDQRPLTRPVEDGDGLEESLSHGDSQLLLAALEKAVVILRRQEQAEQSEATWYNYLQIRVERGALLLVSSTKLARRYNSHVPR